jgi:dephospho-CoA kinase
MKLCGLTGGVGMGKSTAAGFLSQLGAHVVDTDEIARAIVSPGQHALAEIEKQFGPDFLTASGSLNREALAHVVFNDPAALKRLEAILHPRIRELWRSQVEQWRQENCAVAVVVIPLLFETQAENEFDKIICVACSQESQHNRLISRGWTDTQIRRRIAAQLPTEQKISRSHFVVWTEGLPEVHRRQISEILENFQS